MDICRLTENHRLASMLAIIHYSIAVARSY